MNIIPTWNGINLTRAQLATNFLDRSVPRNLRQVLAQTAGFKARFTRAMQLRPNGFTMDAQGNVRDYERGYAVAVSTYTDVDDLIFNNPNVIASGNASSVHFGYWKSPQGQTYIERTDILDYQNDALEYAWQHGQMAIYDFAAKQNIYLADYDRIVPLTSRYAGTQKPYFVPRRIADNEGSKQ